MSRELPKKFEKCIRTSEGTHGNFWRSSKQCPDNFEPPGRLLGNYRKRSRPFPMRINFNSEEDHGKFQRRAMNFPVELDVIFGEALFREFVGIIEKHQGKGNCWESSKQLLRKLRRISWGAQEVFRRSSKGLPGEFRGTFMEGRGNFWIVQRKFPGKIEETSGKVQWNFRGSTKR